MNKLQAINAWRVAQGMEPLESNGKTAKARESGKIRQHLQNQAMRAQANRDMKSNRNTLKKGR